MHSRTGGTIQHNTIQYRRNLYDSVHKIRRHSSSLLHGVILFRGALYVMHKMTAVYALHQKTSLTFVAADWTCDLASTSKTLIDSSSPQCLVRS